MRKVLRILHNYLLFIILFTIIVEILFAAALFFFVPARYMAKATLMVSSQAAELNLDSYDLDSKLLEDYREVCKTDRVLKKAAAEAQIDISPERLRPYIKISAISGTNFINIGVWAENGADAAALANALSRSLISEVSELYQIDNLQLLDEAKAPAQPARMSFAIMLGIGLLAALLLACIIALLRNYFDDTIRTVEQASAIFGKPVLGQIPHGVTRLRKR